MTSLTSFLATTNYRSPFLRTLVPTLGLAYGIQTAFAIPSILACSEKFYDLSGSLTYISCTVLSLTLPTFRARTAAPLAAWLPKPTWSTLLVKAGQWTLNWRQVALSAAVSIWATRLGTYLFVRISSDKDGSRFQKLRQKPLPFLGAFMRQATCVSLCLMPVVALNSLSASTFTGLGSEVTVTDIVGSLLYLGGLGVQVTADRKRSAWSQEKKEGRHNEDFPTQGLWSKCRHPNYFGESTLWAGIATVSAGVLFSKPGLSALGLSAGLAGKAVALLTAGISPAFVTFLRLKVSGVPLSERKNDDQFGDREAYQRWKRETPMFFPKVLGQ